MVFWFEHFLRKSGEERCFSAGVVAQHENFEVRGVVIA